MTLENVFDRLWIDYTNQNPSAKKVYNLFTGEGENVLNDHIAFRTFDDPRINIDVLSKVFTDRGYVSKGEYIFEDKHLFARHFEHLDDKNAPRVFISELKTKDFSEFLQKTINESIDKIPIQKLRSEDLIFSGNVWCTPDYDTYLALRNESEYAAWVYVYGFRANHFTVSINGLKKYNTIEKVNDFLKSNGFVLNSSGGEIKGTKEELLQQSSTLADHVKVEFTDKVVSIPACYYEFAQRYHDSDGGLYSGFIAKSADKIFESTNFYTK